MSLAGTSTPCIVDSSLSSTTRLVCVLQPLSPADIAAATTTLDDDGSTLLSLPLSGYEADSGRPLACSLDRCASLLEVISGQQHCSVNSDGTCVTDGSGNYENNERCAPVERASKDRRATVGDSCDPPAAPTGALSAQRPPSPSRRRASTRRAAATGSPSMGTPIAAQMDRMAWP